VWWYIVCEVRRSVRGTEQFELYFASASPHEGSFLFALNEHTTYIFEKTTKIEFGHFKTIKPQTTFYLEKEQEILHVRKYHKLKNYYIT
jgi:hypothetical protein